MNIPLFLTAAFVAQVFATITGFGAATVLTPVATYMMDIKAAIVLVALFHLIGNITKIGLFWKKIEWRLFAQFGGASLLLTILGAMLSNKMPSAMLKLVFGLFLLSYICLSFLHPTWKVSPTTRSAFMGGAFSGFVSGLIGTGGAIRAAFLTAFQLEKERYIGTSAMIAVLIDLNRLIVYSMNGNLVEKPSVWFLLGLIVVALSGAKLGKILVGRISQKTFQRVVMISLLLVGIHFLISGLSQL